MAERRLDLLLVNPGGRGAIYQSLGVELAAVEPPVWAGLMAAFVRGHGFSVAILDANAQNLTPREAAQEIALINPFLTAVVAYGHNPSASTQVMPAAGAICSALKERNPDSRVLLVGGHVASLPERTLREEEVDFVADGEGPHTLLDLLQALKSTDCDYRKVRGLWYRDQGKLNHTPPAPLVSELDGEMPGVAWDLLPMKKYRAHNWHGFGRLDQRQPYASLYTTLGCPFHCTYCCIQAPFKKGEKVMGYREGSNSYRRWSPQSVLRQIDQLVLQYGVGNIKFADEIFVLNARHVNTICDLLQQRGYDLNIWAYARVDTLQEDQLEKLQQAGVRWLCLGFESGSERVRRDVQKGYPQEKAYRAVKKLRAAGIYVIANYLFGLPEDDFATMQATLDLAIELNCEFANFYCAMAYPGSRLYEIAREQGWPLPAAWSGYSQHAPDTLPLPTRYLAGGEVLRFRDQAFQDYFRRPKYSSMITREFGAKTARHVEEMVAQPLLRNDPAPCGGRK